MEGYIPTGASSWGRAIDWCRYIVPMGDVKQSRDDGGVKGSLCWVVSSGC